VTAGRHLSQVLSQNQPIHDASQINAEDSRRWVFVHYKMRMIQLIETRFGVV
jgi:hypothetical protein